MQQGYPPVQYAGQQGMYPTDPAGYPVSQQNLGSMMGYPPQGMQVPQAGYPPQPMMGQPMMAPQAAYPPMPGGAPPPAMGMGAPGAIGTGAMGFEDPYAYAQQFGLSRGEVDNAMGAYQELNSDMDRGLLGSFGLGTAQKLLQQVFGSAGNEQMVGVLVGVLGTALASGRMPTMKDFIRMMGQYKMNSLGQSFGGKLMGHSSAPGQQYAGLGTMGTGYGQTSGGAMGGGGLGAMMGNILHGNEHGGKKHKEKGKKKKK